MYSLAADTAVQMKIQLVRPQQTQNQSEGKYDWQNITKKRRVIQIGLLLSRECFAFRGREQRVSVGNHSQNGDGLLLGSVKNLRYLRGGKRCHNGIEFVVWSKSTGSVRWQMLHGRSKVDRSVYRKIRIDQLQKAYGLWSGNKRRSKHIQVKKYIWTM